MASEVFSVREGGVNPINAQRGGIRIGSSLSKMKELPEFDVRYEMPTLKKNSERINAVFVSNSAYNRTSSVTFQPSSSMDERVIINVPKKKMLGLLKAVDGEKDYSVKVSFPKFTSPFPLFFAGERRFSSLTEPVPASGSLVFSIANAN